MRQLLLLLLALMLMIPSVQAQQPGPDGKCRDAAGGEIPCDTDGDGITDDVDQCVAQAGPADNRGCPVVAPVVPTTPPTEQPQSTQPEQPQSTNPQPEQPQTTGGNLPPAPTVAPTVNLPVLNTTGNCVTATQDTNLVNMRRTPSAEGEVLGRLNPELVYRIYAVQDNDEGRWYLLRGGWVASWVMRQGGECEGRLFTSVQYPYKLLSIANDTEETALLLPAVQKVREAAARMKVSTGVAEFPLLVFDADPEGEWWLTLPTADGTGVDTIIRINTNTEPGAFFAFDLPFDPPAYDPGFRGGVFVGMYQDTDPSDNGGTSMVDLMLQNPPDPTAAQADYYLKLDGIDGEVEVFPLPELDGTVSPGTTPYGLFIGADGQFRFSSDDTEGNEDDVPFIEPLFFDVGPGQGPSFALKGKPMHLVNNTAPHHENGDETGYKLENVLISSIVYNLPERTVGGWLYPDPTTGQLLFSVRDVEGTQTDGMIVLDEAGDLVFVPEGTEPPAQVTYDLKAAKKFYAIPPATENIDGLIIGSPEETAASGHVKVFDGQTGGLDFSVEIVDDPSAAHIKRAVLFCRKSGGD